VVNTVSGALNLDIDDMSRAAAESRIASKRVADLEQARKLPKGSDVASAMRRRADAYKLAKIVQVVE